LRFSLYPGKVSTAHRLNLLMPSLGMTLAVASHLHR
jgi:hypothetical protein